MFDKARHEQLIFFARVFLVEDAIFSIFKSGTSKAVTASNTVPAIQEILRLQAPPAESAKQTMKSAPGTFVHELGVQTDECKVPAIFRSAV